MKIQVNGEIRECPEVETVRAFLAECGLDPAKMLVLLNGESLPEAELDRVLNENDRLEILRIAGGG